MLISRLYKAATTIVFLLATGPLAIAQITLPPPPAGCDRVMKNYSPGQTMLNGKSCVTASNGCFCNAFACTQLGGPPKFVRRTAYRNVQCQGNPR